jgi:arabinose-5-phosphate isomerase
MQDHNNIAKRVILKESEALMKLSNNLSNDFSNIVDHIINFKGRVILTGIGKSGYIAHKIAASFASTGTAAFYLHPAEASHGDLGMVTESDLVIMLSIQEKQENYLI